MHEGGADPEGSLSFAQVLYKYRYGADACKQFTDSELNFYHPADNLKSFAVFLGMHDSPCGKGPFKRAFIDNELSNSFEADISNLVGYRHNGSTITPIGKSDTIYETFARAVGLYNGGKSLEAMSWPKILKVKRNPTPEQEVEEKGRNAGKNCFSCAYSISVRNQNFGLPFRQYIWQGGTSKQDLNGDGLFKKLDNDPRTTGDVVDPIDENAVPWCFVYGEEEWLKRVSYQDAFDQTRRIRLKVAEEGDYNYGTICK